MVEGSILVAVTMIASMEGIMSIIIQNTAAATLMRQNVKIQHPKPKRSVKKRLSIKLFATLLFLALTSSSVFGDCYDDLINGINNEAKKGAVSGASLEVSFKLVNGKSKEVYVALPSGDARTDNAAITAIRQGTLKIRACPDFQQTIYFIAKFDGKKATLARIDGIEFNSYRENAAQTSVSSRAEPSEHMVGLYNAHINYLKFLEADGSVPSIPDYKPVTAADYEMANLVLGKIIKDYEAREKRKKIVWGSIIAWLVGAFLALIVSAGKKRSALKWTLGTLLLSPLLVIVLLFLPALDEMKKCPFCAEEVNIDAMLCKHCGKDLPKNETQTQPAI